MRAGSWCVYANDTSNYWNSTSCITPFTYTTTNLTVASVSTDQTSYSACGAVFYRISLYDQRSSLINSNFTIKILNPALSAVSSQSSSPNNGTGVYTSSYMLNSTSELGVWLLKVLENGGVTAGKNFFVVTTCGDKVCGGGENHTDCPSDC